VSAYLVGGRAGDETQVFGTGRFHRPGEPVGIIGLRADWSQVDLLISEGQCGSFARSKCLSRHAENPLIPGCGGIDIAAVHNDVVEPLHDESHVLTSYSARLIDNVEDGHLDRLDNNPPTCAR
jgi:hypothetical protein